MAFSAAQHHRVSLPTPSQIFSGIHWSACPAPCPDLQMHHQLRATFLDFKPWPPSVVLSMSPASKVVPSMSSASCLTSRAVLPSLLVVLSGSAHLPFPQPSTWGLLLAGQLQGCPLLPSLSYPCSLYLVQDSVYDGSTFSTCHHSLLCDHGNHRNHSKENSKENRQQQRLLAVSKHVKD